MSLVDIVRAKGGDIYAGGHRASIPAPGHSPTDRSASLVIGRTGRVVAFSFGGATPFEILDDLKARGLIDRAGYPGAGGASIQKPSCPSDGQKRGVAEDLWSAGVPLPETSSARYLHEYRAIARDLVRIKNVLHNPACRVAAYQRNSRFTRPALMSRIVTPQGQTTAVELTYLDPTGDRDGKLKLSRKTVGVVPPGSFVQLDDPAYEMLVAEGVMTALSASDYFGLPAHALLGIRNLRAFRPPACVRSILIAADRGVEGEWAAVALREILVSLGLMATVHLPPERFRDFNQMAQVMGRRAKEEGEGRGRVTGR
ncbi:toprim domain-containing protein [Asticcacaulis sp. AC460]|uniref:toprim domain-containing protein n=1 Tax=Asticcacaulis sp. AC460 TaxID=1282360 RepID=UPI0009DF1AC8|nr:toprim domain-containing protein [Asticcacaulis sp. AC460]